MPKFRPFGAKSINFLIFWQNLACTLFRRCWSQIWHLFSKILNPNVQIWVFWVKKYSPSNLNKMSLVPYFEGAGLKSDICFPKFWAQMPKPGHFGPKSINFLILMKFCLYPGSKVLISNQTFVFKNSKTKFPDFGVLSKKNPIFLS